MVEVKGRDKLKVGPFNLEFVTVTHSIPDALAVYVRRPAGSLIDTGDIKLDQLPLDHKITDLVEFGKIGRAGRGSADDGLHQRPRCQASSSRTTLHSDPRSTRRSRRRAPARSSSPQLLPRTCTASQQVVDVAPQVRAQGRLRRPLDGAQHVHRRRPRLPAHPRSTVIDLKKAHDVQDDKLVFMCTGSQGEPLSALSRMANGEHKTLSIHEGDTVILSALPFPATRRPSSRSSTAWPSSAATCGIRTALSSTSPVTVARRSSSS